MRYGGGVDGRAVSSLCPRAHAAVLLCPVSVRVAGRQPAGQRSLPQRAQHQHGQRGEWGRQRNNERETEIIYCAHL